VTTCPCCNGTGVIDPDLDGLRRECAEKGIAILPGDRVNGLRDVATLVGVAPGTFRNWRMWKDIPLGETEIDGTVSYALADIATLRNDKVVTALSSEIRIVQPDAKFITRTDKETENGSGQHQSHEGADVRPLRHRQSRRS
jgi:hypothetical protein